MKSYRAFEAAILACIIFAAVVSAFLEGENKEVLCKGHKIEHTADFNKNMKDCIAEFKAAKSTKMAGERKRGKTCIVVCALTKDGVFDDKGALVETKIMSNVDDKLPKDIAPILKAELTTCVTNTTIKSVVSNATDHTCSEYKPFLKCSGMAWMKTCIEGFDAEIWNED